LGALPQRFALFKYFSEALKQTRGWQAVDGVMVKTHDQAQVLAFFWPSWRDNGKIDDPTYGDVQCMAGNWYPSSATIAEQPDLPCVAHLSFAPQRRSGPPLTHSAAT
jgi:hypothetical protein